MKKTITILCIVVMVATLAVGLFACNDDKTFGDDSIKAFEPQVSTMGLTMPTQAPKVDLNLEELSKKESLTNAEVDAILAGLTENFYNSDFVTTYLRGTCTTKVLGSPVTQVVVGDKMRIGKTTDSDVQYWADNRSYSMFAKVYDETLMDFGSNKYFYRDTNKNNCKYSEGSDNSPEEHVLPYYFDEAGNKIALKDKLKVKRALEGWTKFEPNAAESFDNKANLVERSVNDPTRIWMYDTDNEGAVKEASKLQKFGEDKYIISVNFDKDKAVKNYIDVLFYMLIAGAGDVQNLQFVGLKFDIVLWENGYLADLYIQEEYQMAIAGILEAQVTLNSRQQYSYDINEQTSNPIVKHLNERRLDAVNNWAK